MRRWSLCLLLLPAIAGATGGHALDPAAPEVELVVRQDVEGYHYELHPVGQHGALNGKFYGSSEWALQGSRQFVVQMPYPNPEAVPLEEGGDVDAAFIFGVTNRGQGEYQVTWQLAAGGELIAEGAPQSFNLQGQQTDVGSREVHWRAEALMAGIPAEAEMVLTIDIDFSGNAPYVKDRGVRISLPAAPQSEASTALPTEPATPPRPEDGNETGQPELDQEPGVDAEQHDAAPEGSRRGDEKADRAWLWVPVIVVLGLMGMVLVSRRK